MALPYNTAYHKATLVDTWEGATMRRRNKSDPFDKASTHIIGRSIPLVIEAAVEASSPQPEFTTQDFLDVFVPHEAHPVLRAYHKHGAKWRDMSYNIACEGIRLNCAWPLYSNIAPALQNILTPQGDHPRFQLLSNWATRRATEIKYYNNIQAAYNLVAEKCTQANQVTFFLPGLLAIIKAHYPDTHTVKLLHDLPEAKYLPSLGPNGRELVEKANTAITSAQLLGVLDGGEDKDHEPITPEHIIFHVKGY